MWDSMSGRDLAIERSESNEFPGTQGINTQLAKERKKIVGRRHFKRDVEELGMEEAELLGRISSMLDDLTAGFAGIHGELVEKNPFEKIVLPNRGMEYPPSR